MGTISALEKKSDSIVLEDIKEIVHLTFLKELSDKTLLIFGSTGMIGKYIVNVIMQFNCLHDEKCKVILAVRDYKGAEKIFEKYKDSKCLTIKEADICSAIIIEERVDFIIHAASLTNPVDYIEKPVDTYLPNIVGTDKILRLGYEKSVKTVLFISSASVYGNVDGVSCLKEEDSGIIQFNQYSNSYAESKRMGENMCMSFKRQFGLPIKIVRPFHMYGPGMNLHGNRMIDDFFRETILRRKIVLKSAGKALRNYSYLSDVVAIIMLVLLCGQEGEVYNIGNPYTNMTVKNFAEILAAVGKAELQFEYSSNDNLSRIDVLIPNLDKMLKLAGNTIKFHGIEEGIRRTLVSYGCVMDD